METEIREALHTALRELGVTDISFSVEHPADTAHGDYATNIALVSAQALGKSPRSCAEEIVTFLGKKKIPQVERIEIAGPGFINFFLTRDFFGEKIAEAQKLKGTWGHNDSLKGQTILIEKSAPNLYKPFHIGHLLNITIGESLSRLMQSAGAVSIDMAYPSDISLGVAKAVWSLVQTGADPSDIRTLGDAYVAGTKAYEESAEAKEEIIEINKSLNIKHEGEVWDVYEKGRETSLNYFRVMTARLGSVFSDTFFESEAGILGKEIVEANMPDVFSESEGAVVFKGEDYGLHTRVFVTSLGLPLYEAKDIGLIKWKFEKYNPDLSVVITDMEQKQYFEVIKKAAELVHGEWGERSVYWQHGRLRFADGKVSSRLGNVPLAETMLEEVKQIALQKITETNRDIPDGDIDDLAEDIAVGAIKYSFLRVAAGQNIVFDFGFRIHRALLHLKRTAHTHFFYNIISFVRLR